MHDIKMIVTDYDGTFVVHSAKGAWEKDNADALLEARAAGILVYPCTGRPWPQVSRLMGPFVFDGLCVSTNGAAIVDMQSGAQLYCNCLSPEMTKSLIEIAYRHNMLVQACTSKHVGFLIPDGRTSGYVIPPDRDVLSYTEGHRNSTDTDKYGFYLYGSVNEMVEANLHTTELFRFVIAPDDLTQSMKDDFAALTDIEITWSHAYHMDIMAKGVSKGSAVVKLAELKGIDLEHVMALGDNENDTSMLSAVGVGVAMGDATESAKAAARYISVPAVDGGFAHAVRKYALGMTV